MKFEDFLRSKKLCNEECTKVFKKIQKEFEDEIGFKLDKDKPEDYHCFRLYFPTPIGEDKNITKISIAIPPDAMGNRTTDGHDFPMCIETALFSDTNIEYDESLGYEDIMRFYGDDRASEQSNVLELKSHILSLYSQLEKENEKYLDNEKNDIIIDSSKALLQYLRFKRNLEHERALKAEVERKLELERALKAEAERKLELGKKQRDEAEARYKEAEVDNDKKNVCVVCLENKKTHAFNPCGHMCVCETCADEIIQRGSNCPMCRADITSLLKIFT
jgi:hypothetical protein